MHSFSDLVARSVCRRVFALSLLALLFLSTPTAAQNQPPAVDRIALQGVNVLSLSSSTQVFLSVERPVRYSVKRISRPPRVVLELQNVAVASRVHREIRVGDDYLRSIEVQELPDGIVRVNLLLNPLKSSHYSVLSEPPAMLLEITPSGLPLEPDVERTETTPPPQPARPATPSVPRETQTAQPTQPEKPAQTPAAPAPTPSVTPLKEPPASVQVPPRRVTQPVSSPAPAPDEPSHPTGSINGHSKIYRLDVEEQPDRTRVFVGLQRVGTFRRGTLKNPDRLYIDFPGMKISPSVAKQTDVDDSRIKRIRFGQFKTTVARVVLDLEEDCVHRIETQSSPPGMIIDILKPGAPKEQALLPGPGEMIEEDFRPTGQRDGPPVVHEVVPPSPPRPSIPAVAQQPSPVPPIPPVPPAPVMPPAVPVPSETPTQEQAAITPAGPPGTPDRDQPPPTGETQPETPLPPSSGKTIVLAAPDSVTIPYVKRPPKLEDFLGNQPREAEAKVDGFRQRSPQDGAPVSEETTAYLSYDDDNLYVVFDCKDDPSEIRSRMSKREQITRDDQVIVYLDTYRDMRRAFIFATNPLGIQRDGILTEGQGSDYKFDTLWDSEGRLTNDGFMVWIKIPFRSLRFSRSQDQTWGLALGRSIRRKEEYSYWPYITRQVEGFVQQMGELHGLNDISPGRNFEAIPYATYTNSRNLDSFNDGLGYTTEDEFQAGVDAKAVFRDSLTLDMTLNPDFSQVESDEPQVTINRRFEVFFPEKRPFFLENADFFETPERLFFSRRIADPQYGARLTGKVGDWRMGILAIDDEAPGRRVSEGDINSGKRAGNAVIRLQRDFGDQSNVGLLITSRDFASTYNRVFGIDTRLKLNDNWFFTGQASGSETREGSGKRISDPAYLARLSHSGAHSNFGVGYLDRAPEFRSQLGFIPRVDIRQTDTYYQYLWYPNGGKVISFGPSVSGLSNWDREGRLQDWFVNANFRLDLLGPTNIELNRYESFTLYQDLEFRYGRTDVSLFTGFLNWIEFFVSYGGGSDINYNPGPGLQPFLADSRDASVFVGIRPLSQLSIDGTYLFTSLRTRGEVPPVTGPEPVTIFNNHLVRWRANYQFNRELSFRAILDYYSVIPNSDLVYLDRDKFVTYDFLITYLLNPGTALYLGYTNRLWNVEYDPSDPFGYRRSGFPTTSTSRQFFVKISKLFRF